MTTTSPVDTTTQSEFLTHVREEMVQRLADIKPQAESLTNEVQYIEATLQAWDKIEAGENIFAKAEAGAQRARATTTRRKRSNGGRGKVGDAVMQALLDADRPLSIPELADKVGTHPNYLYRVMPKLEQEGSVEKDGKQFKAVGSA